MNSTSSSSESDDENLYNSSFRRHFYRRTPLCTTLGHPLVYFAEIKPKRKRSRRNGENEKDKSNCFLKAFRWYTQEHVPFKNNQSNDTNTADMDGFATWLDDKYNEYLQISENDQNRCILSQASTLQIVHTDEVFEKKQRSFKKFPRIKSPWRKRAKSLIDNDKTNFNVKSNQSIKITLKSKSLSRPASACCQRSNTKLQSNRSNSSIIYDARALRMKLKPDSKSLTSILKEKDVYVIPFDTLRDAKHKDLKVKLNGSGKQDRKKIKQIFPKKESVSSVKSQSKRDVHCQCSDNALEKNDSSHKLEKRSNTCGCYERKQVGVAQQIQGADTNTKSSSVSAPFNDSAQTSDYSINLEKDMFHNNPIFMKIVCVNKLK